MKKIFSGILFFTATVSFAQLSPFKYDIKKNVTANKAAVVSAHPLASDAGLQVMKQGGNAFDAAIATQLALAVVYPGAGNLGGGGFMVAHLKNGKNIALDYREMAPAKASRDMYLDGDGNPVTLLSMQGQLASGVPGTVAGLFSILKYAKLPFAILAAPAITLADRGFALTEAQAADFNYSKNIFVQMNKNSVAFVKETAWKAGDILVQKELAATLKRISNQGQKGFYEGETAMLIAAEMKNGNGIITLEDLKNYKVKEREVMQFSYKGNEVITMPLPSSGGIILQQLLKIMEKRNLAAMPFQSVEAVQLITEAERRTFADRAEFLGDPDFVKVPVATLTSNEYLEDRMKDYDATKAGSSKTTTAGIIHESEQTTHLSIIDGEGNAVAVTTTLNDHFGSKTVISGAGFIMNNEMDDFSVKPGVPNMYGAIGNAKNAIAPGKRMLSSMTPTIVLKDGKPFIVVGTPGGTTIPTSVFQTIVNIIDHGMSAADAVNKPKFHHQWLPDVIYVEKYFDKTTKEKLKTMGYIIAERGAIGRTELIEIEEQKIDAILLKTNKDRLHSIRTVKKITAVADERGDDDARGL